MEQIYNQRELINLRLQNLSKSPKVVQPTKMQLHSPRRMMDRVQRMENKRYQQEIAKQQKDFLARQKKINEHLSYVEKELARRDVIITDYNSIVPEIGEPLDKSLPIAPVFSALPSYDLKPIKAFPKRTLTRIQSKQRLRENR